MENTELNVENFEVQKKNFTETNESTDTFEDLKKFRLSQNFLEMANIQKSNSSLLVRRPQKQEFVRTTEDNNLWFQVYLLMLEEDKEYYLATPEIAAELEGDVRPYVIVPTMSRQGTLFLWPVPLSDEEGKTNAWHASLLEAAKIGLKKWVRVYFKNLGNGQYEVLTAKKDKPAPEWPTYSLSEYMKLGFKDRCITSLDHPAVRRLQGEE